MCHLRDYEQLFYQRAQLMLKNDNPTFPNVSNELLIEQNAYDRQDVHEAFQDYLQKRREFIGLLESLTDEQWSRRGIHPQTGETTVLTLAINTALHDINHIGQIVQAMGDR